MILSPLSREKPKPTISNSKRHDDQQNDRVRRPISLKIFSIALGLLCLMTIVTILSAWNLSQVNNQVRSLADYYIPLSHSISKMEIDVGQQLIHLERLILHQQSQQVDLAAIKQERAEFDKKGKNVEEEITATQHMVVEASASAQSETDRVALAKLEPEIEDIQLAHQHLRDTVLKFLAEVKHGNQQAVHVLHEAIVTERQKFDSEIQDVRRLLHRFTQMAATKAKDLEKEALTLNWGITLAAVILGVVFASVLTRNLAKPITRLVQGTRFVEQGDLNVQLEVTSRDEVAALTKSFNRMVSELRQKELIKDTFGKYVDPRIVKSLLEDQQFAQEAQRQSMTVLFADLEGFTSLSERMTPDGVVKFLNNYFTSMSTPVHQYNGIVDKYIGDAIMAFWGPPFTTAFEHPTQACLAALEQLAKLHELRRMPPEVLGSRRDLPPINMRIGLATGEVLVGNIGSSSSKRYTVIGDSVNLAARLETANKLYGTNVLISEETWKQTRGAVAARELDYIRVVGRSEPVRVFELLAPQGKLSPAEAQLRDCFEQALQAYRNRDWAQAEAGFVACLEIKPEDAPPRVFLSRLKYLQEHPPEDNWAGLWSLPSK